MASTLHYIFKGLGHTFKKKETKKKEGRPKSKEAQGLQIFNAFVLSFFSPPSNSFDINFRERLAPSGE